jgi:hypothetical protein
MHWMQWLADVLTPGIDPKDAEQKAVEQEQVDHNIHDRDIRLSRVEKDTEAIKRLMKADVSLIRRQQDKDR